MDDCVPNRNSPPAVLLRRPYWQDGKVRKETLANLSKWPDELVENFRVLLKGGVALASLDDAFRIVRSRPPRPCRGGRRHRASWASSACWTAKPSRDRSLAAAMALARVLDPGSKLATARSLRRETLASTLGEEFEVEDADADELYRAMDWLLARQAGIERRLARKHMEDGSLVLCDVTSTYFEGRHCALARRGYSHDGKRGLVVDRLRAAVRDGRLSGGGRGVRGEHGGPGDAGRPGEEAVRALRALEGRGGGRPEAADERAHPGRGRAGGVGLDHGAARARGQEAGRRRMLADVAVRRAGLGGDRGVGAVSGRAAGGVQEPAAGRSGRRARLQGPWSGSNARSAASRSSISRCGPSTTAWPVGCAPTSSCAFSPTNVEWHMRRALAPMASHWTRGRGGPRLADLGVLEPVQRWP